MDSATERGEKCRRTVNGRERSRNQRKNRIPLLWLKKDLNVQMRSVDGQAPLI